MSIRSAIKVCALWTITWTAGGSIVGIGIGLGDTGHVGSLGSILILGAAGSIFGAVGGGVFAPVFTWIASRMPSSSALAAVATLLGTLSGLLGIYIADRVVGITNAAVVGSVAGAISGLACWVIPASAYGHHKRTAEPATRSNSP